MADRLPVNLAAELAERGFVRVPALVSPPVIERLQTAVDRLLIPSGPYGAIGHNVWRRDPAFLAAAAELELDALARAAAGVDLLWFQDHLITKPPGCERAIPWHQDYSYWPLDRSSGVTMWIALDDAGLDGGCLAYVAGSHRTGERRPTRFAGGAPESPRLAGLAPIGDADADARQQPISVHAGDALLHHPLTWHRSGPNRGAGPRRAWSISWIDAEARWDPEHAPHPFLAELEAPSGAAVAGDLFPRLTSSR